MRLQDKAAIITGAGSGIGQGIALMFAKEGAKVVCAGRRAEAIQDTVLKIKENGGEGLAIQTDVSSFDQVSQMVHQTLGKYGKIDILVNNAGVYSAGDAVSATEEDWNKVMGIDVKGVWYCSKAVLPHMLEKGKGKIINIASIAGLVGFGGSAFYCAAKGAVVNLTREMALDYAKKGININAIAPGVIESEMTRPFLSDENTAKGFLAQTPVGRIGKPEDIAYGAVYLSSDESDFVTGHILTIDGGWTVS